MQKTALKLTLLALCLCALTNKANGQSGNCGNGVNYAITGTAPNQTLTISYDGLGTGVMTDYLWNAYAPWYAYKDDLKTLVIDNGVTTIGNYAFQQCDRFTGTLTIPNTVTYIGDWAFERCRGFTGDLIIPNSVTSIKDRAFWQCSGFTSFTLPKSITTIPLECFYGWNSLIGSLIIPNTITTIGDGAFNGCSGITSLTIPNSVTSIGSSAFSNCTGIASIISHATSPPIINLPTFGISITTPVYVPCQSVSSYLSPVSGWTYYVSTNISCTSYELISLSNDNLLGKVSSSGNYLATSNVNLYAAPKANAVFVNWSDGDTNNPRTIILTKDSTITANFALHNIAGLNQQIANLEQDTATLNAQIAGLENDTATLNGIISLLTAPAPINTVVVYKADAMLADSIAFAEMSGSTPTMTIVRGAVAEGELVYLTPNPPAGNHLHQWVVTPSDLTVINNTFVMPNTAVTITAFYVYTNYTIKYELDGGTVNGWNREMYNMVAASFTLVNPTKDGYTFAGWVGTDLTEPTMTVSISNLSGNRHYTALWTNDSIEAQIIQLQNDTTLLNSIITSLQTDTLRLYNQVIVLETDTAYLRSLLDGNTYLLLSQIDALKADTANLNLQITQLIADTVRIYGENLFLEAENFLLRDTISDLKQLLDDCLNNVCVPTIVDKEFKIYPNPTTGLLTIEKETGVIGQVDVFDVTGKLLQSTIVNQQSIILDITHLAKGMYYLKIDNVVVKIIKN